MKSETTTQANSQKQADVVDGDVAGELLKLIGLANSSDLPEQRVRDRFPIYCCMQLVPLDGAGKSLPDEQMSVVGKDLSTRGISFSHDTKLPSGRFIICLSLSETARVKVEAEITWTRQTPIGLYETGCRLIRKVD
jgi:hypothetical protein